jgi:GDP-4-dehydro-6-deoxy-D-mannose reductase
MKVMVTGAGGFVGRHLIDHLKAKHKVIATGRSLTSPAGLQAPYLNMDITDPASIKEALQQAAPEAVFHLAAQSKVELAWTDPASTVYVNIIGTINLVNAIKDILPLSRLMTVGSGEEYGLSGKLGEPLTEEHPCQPQNPYATSKLAMGQLALQLAQKHGLKLLHLRPFNHFGPGQQLGYVVSDFASQVAEIEQKNRPPVLKVGNLEAERDFTDVRDVVQAYALLLDKDPDPGIYNVCSGVACSAGKILKILLSYATVPITVEQDPDRLRPSEVPFIVGSNAKLYQATGWQPKQQFESSIRETLNWWRSKIKAG